MTSDDILKMAREVWQLDYFSGSEVAKLERFAALVAEAERDSLQERVKVLEDAIETELGRLYASNNGSTHFAGCEKNHPRCAAILRMNAALGERT
jgi:hypothetical protein